MKPILFLLLLLMGTTCHSQVKSNLEKDGHKILKSKQAKIVKTQGSDEYVNIHCSLMDKAGNLWFGSTGEGVYRYDGQYFTQFTKEDGLSSNVVWCILEDNTGNIWFGTDNGICRYDGQNITHIPISEHNSFYPNASSTSNGDPSAGNDVWSLLQDKSGTIWIGAGNGVYCFNGISFTHFPQDNILNNGDHHLKMVQCMLEDEKGNIWFGSGPSAMEGVCRYDGRSLTCSKPNGDGWIRFMLADKSGNIWFSGRSRGVFRYDGKVFIPFTEKDEAGAPVFQDRAGNIWFTGGENDNGFGGKGGIWRYDGRSFTNFTTKDGLGDYSVWSMVQDRDGNIWIGTRNNGLYRYDGKTFTCFSE